MPYLFAYSDVFIVGVIGLIVVLFSWRAYLVRHRRRNKYAKRTESQDSPKAASVN